MTKKIDFYFDFISPYSCLAHKKIINLNLRNFFNYFLLLVINKFINLYDPYPNCLLPGEKLKIE